MAFCLHCGASSLASEYASVYTRRDCLLYSARAVCILTRMCVSQYKNSPSCQQILIPALFVLFRTAVLP